MNQPHRCPFEKIRLVLACLVGRNSSFHAGFRVLFVGFLLLLMQTAPVLAQGVCFSTNKTRICVGDEIEIIDCSSPDVTQDSKSWNYGDSTVYDPNAGPRDKYRTSEDKHIYTKPGIYTVIMYGSKNFGTQGDSTVGLRKIEVLPTPEPAFAVGVCANREVRVTITDGVYDSYQISMGANPPVNANRGDTRSASFSDTDPKQITVRGFYTVKDWNNVPIDKCPGPGSTVTVTPIISLIKPQLLSLTVQDGASAELRFRAEPVMKYRVEQKNAAAAFQTVATFDNPTPGEMGQTITGLSTANTSHTFRVVTYDVCGNTFVSDEISTIALAVLAGDSQNLTNWTIHPTSTLVDYNLYRNDQLLNTFSPGQTNFTDEAIVCPEQYCYRTEATLSGGAKSISNSVCVTAFSTRKPPALQNVKATVENGQSVVSWEAPNTGKNEYFLSRSENGGAYTDTGRIFENRFADRNARLESANYCYRVSFRDACGNRSAESIEVCPVRLTTTDTGNGFALNWSAYREWPGGITEYVVEKLDAAGNVLHTQPAGLNLNATEPSDTINQVIVFRIKAVSNNGVVSYSNATLIQQKYQLYFPDAFTPNGDRVNDFYTIKGLFLKQTRMLIYDRWGGVLFASGNRSEGWDGTANGQPLPPGMYVCLIELEDYTGKKDSWQKAFLLLR